MILTRDEREMMVRELIDETHGHIDGSGKNIIVPVCPKCGKGGGKFGIYIGPEASGKKPFMSHCFKCGWSTYTLDQLLDLLGRPDLKIEEKASFGPVEIPDFYKLESEDEIDDELERVTMPDGWKRCFRNHYLKQRGFTADDYEYFPVGTTRGLNFKYDDYVIFPIIDSEVTVGYVSRHTWDKSRIDRHNYEARRNNRYQIRRYNNSTENDFVRLLYNYDAIIEDETDTVILCEGIFDVIALTRKLDLYDNHRIVPVATFGKKISTVQLYKLQAKGVKTVVVGYDGDAHDSTVKAAEVLDEYFDVYICHIDDPRSDFDSMGYWEIFDAFTKSLKTLREFKLQTVQQV